MLELIILIISIVLLSIIFFIHVLPKNNNFNGGNKSTRVVNQQNESINKKNSMLLKGGAGEFMQYIVEQLGPQPVPNGYNDDEIATYNDNMWRCAIDLINQYYTGEIPVNSNLNLVVNDLIHSNNINVIIKYFNQETLEKLCNAGVISALEFINSIPIGIILQLLQQFPQQFPQNQEIILNTSLRFVKQPENSNDDKLQVFDYLPTILGAIQPNSFHYVLQIFEYIKFPDDRNPQAIIDQYLFPVAFQKLQEAFDTGTIGFKLFRKLIHLFEISKPLNAESFNTFLTTFYTQEQNQLSLNVIFTLMSGFSNIYEICRNKELNNYIDDLLYPYGCNFFKLLTTSGFTIEHYDGISDFLSDFLRSLIEMDKQREHRIIQFWLSPPDKPFLLSLLNPENRYHPSFTGCLLLSLYQNYQENTNFTAQILDPNILQQHIIYFVGLDLRVIEFEVIFRSIIPHLHPDYITDMFDKIIDSGAVNSGNGIIMLEILSKCIDPNHAKEILNPENSKLQRLICELLGRTYDLSLISILGDLLSKIAFCAEAADE